ncbi:MAG: hypothetical protein FK734_06425 [Asgard group archaeon]|nr:hypothetical protein [Asgard group archaeon]
MSNNIDNLLGEIYTSDSQSQGVKELANLINNLSQLLLKAISQLEARVGKLEQQVARGGVAPAPRMQQPTAPSPMPTPPPAPKPKVASPFSAPVAPVSTPQPTATPTVQQPVAQTPAPASNAGGGPGSVAEAASMLGVTLTKAPTSPQPTATTSTTPSSGPSFLTGVVNPEAKVTPDAVAPTTAQPEAMAPSTGGGVAGPTGGFRGELAEKLERRRQKVQQQLDDDYESADILDDVEEEEVAEESTSSELKSDLEDELRNAFSKLKG